MKVAFIGSRGIPTRYGGNEVFVEEISKRLVRIGFRVYVTCESNRFYEDEYNGIIRVHAPSVHGETLTIPSLNDILSTFNLMLKHGNDIDIIYYVAEDSALAALILKLLRKQVIINTDGIEWKRLTVRRMNTSLGWKLPFTLVGWYLRIMEWMSVKLADVVIADSRAIKSYLEGSYKAKNVVYVPYGARELLDSELSSEKEAKILGEFDIPAEEYYLTVARIVAENNIHKEIQGFRKSESSKKLVVVGNFNRKDSYTKYLVKLRSNDSRIVFLDPIYDRKTLGVLRKNCYAYIHAYEVGGTNPSLLEQMLFKRPIIAYDVIFNREVLQGGGIYFQDENSLAKSIEMLEKGGIDLKEIAKCQAKRIEEEYNWDSVTEKYNSLFKILIK